MKYGKLVRDNIPDIIKKNGDKPIFHIASEKEYEPMLHAKFREEVDEFLQHETVDEMADVFEVITSILEYHGWNIEQVLAAQTKKREQRGAFKKRIILDETK
jgi:predicted house-cleaning noncanonical NTP pyrophosphatase (MazG superfamily)